MRQTKLKAPFGWIGGKAYVAKHIIKIMPEHKQYVEVFGGAASVLYQKERSPVEIINDINSDLINLHLIIKTRPLSLMGELQELIKSRELFTMIRDGKIEPRNNIQRAAFQFYLIYNSFASNCRSFAMYRWHQRDKRSFNKNYKKDFRKYSDRLKYVTLENLSYNKLINNYDSADTIFYCDPPYVGTEHYYKLQNKFGKEQHEDLFNLLNNIKGKCIISYNDCDFVRKLYKDFIITPINTKYTISRNKNNLEAKEVFITNYEVNKELF